ncbi:BBL_G0020630.mRNA.1.CDS.1 [Saccharomyces cerevisiae]|nr:BBL_G0020630.mRNA.1.CDS.1 [Saccharomyces cerevisiae]CAI7124588.1 BBL_G0020630.mRNA.1.CDS.1 [Saccharomyces cerevisiae]
MSSAANEGCVYLFIVVLRLSSFSCVNSFIHSFTRSRTRSSYSLDERSLVSYSIVYVAMNKSSKAFQVPNKVITKEDITPLSRSHTKKADTRGTADGKNTTASAVEATPIIITTARSIDTAGSLSENATEDDGTQNGDLHDDDDDDDLESTLGYSSEPDPLFSPCHQPSFTNSTFSYSADNELPMEENHNKNNFHDSSESSIFLPQIQQSFFFGDNSKSDANNTDFWKEVNGTAEEAICLQETRQRKCSLVALHPGDATTSSNDTLGIEDFIKDDINSAEAMEPSPSSSPSSSLLDNLDYNIKLLCYRDNEGKFTLKKRKFLKNSLRSSSAISKKWKPLSKRDKLLKRAIRRKSGVCQTLSAGFGIGEFMLQLNKKELCISTHHMSTQSGIVAEQALLHSLNENLSADGIVIIIAKISPDSTSVHQTQVARSFEELVQLASQEREPLYIFYKPEGLDKYFFVSFIPDGSPVRSRMLYASTKNTLARQVGSNSLSTEQPLITDAQDLVDLKNFDSARPAGQNKPLTHDEEMQIEINKQQALLRKNTSVKLVSQDSASPLSLTFRVNSEKPINEILDSEGKNLIIFQIDPSNETIQIVQSDTCPSVDELYIDLPGPSYTIFRQGDSSFFIYSCPSGSKVKDRMIYASNKNGFINYLKNDQKIAFSKVVEIGDFVELDKSLLVATNKEDSLDHGSNPDLPNKSNLKFNKPKGPLRKRRT